MTFPKSGTGLWVVIGTLVVIIGVTASILGSIELARNDGQRSQQEFQTSSVEIASTLTLALERQQDLAVNTGAFIANDQDPSESQFKRWVSSDQVFQRFPELLGVGYVVMVSSAQLPAFARASEEATGAAPGSFQVTPGGSRPYYCFAELTESPSGHLTSPLDLDVCDTELGSSFLAARDSGTTTYLPYGSGTAADLAVGTAIYHGGTAPRTVEARRDAFAGWVGIQVAPRTLLATALHGHPGTAVAFRYLAGRSPVAFRSGTAPQGSRSTTVDLGNGWHVDVLAGVTGSSVFDNPNALLLLVSGTLLSLLLGALLYVLATGRTRALSTVREQTGELRHLALHDPLTGLPNRALILDRIDQMLHRGRRQHVPVAVLFIDLDNFKDINDTLGHAAGDELLIAVAGRLTAATRSGDSVGRLGGDEFVVLTEGTALSAGADSVADRILDAMTAPFTIPSSTVPLSVTASIGYAEGDRASPGRLLQDADIALYEAKAAGKDGSVGFSPAMRANVDSHRHLELDLHGALERGQFFLVYQPTVDLATGRYSGVEALLRWRHPVRGVVMPDQFIPALESTGLIVPVGAWVLHEACRQTVAWAEHGYPLVVSVNVSARQLERDRIIDDVDDALAATGLDGSQLVLELTETALMRNVEASKGRLHLLKALGVRIAIDDFGTGYSSLAYLRQLPIDILKIDRTFVAGMADTTESVALVHTLVQLESVLGLETVAEGIETEEQRHLLEAEGVHTGQGYLFARPLAAEDLQDLLRTHRYRPVSHVV